MPVVDVVSQIVIDRPVSVVADFAADPDNTTRWYANIKSVEWKTARPLRIGSEIAFVAQFLGRRLEYTYEIKDYVPRQRLVMKAADGPFAMETTYEWVNANGKTKMTLRNRGHPMGFAVAFAPFLSFAMRRANQKDLVLLKRILEQA